MRKEHKQKRPPYRIEFTDEANEHVKRKLDAGERALVFDGVEAQLRHEPTRATKHRKKMRPRARELQAQDRGRAAGVL